MATFSERFKKLRKEKGMSQRELATALHMSNSAVAMYETGKRQPDLEALEQIADFFNVDMGIFSCSEMWKCSKFVAK